MRPRIASGVFEKRITERSVGAHGVGRAGDREHHHPDPERGREPEAGDRRAPDDDRNGDADALAADVLDPAREQRGKQRPDRERGVEEADHPGPASKCCTPTAGKSACGIPKTIAFVSSTKVPRIDPLPGEEAKAVLERVEAGPVDGALRPRRRDQRDQHDERGANETTSIMYVAPKPAVAIRMPPIAGPTIAPALK